MSIEDNLQDLLEWRKRFILDDIEPPESPAAEETLFLSEKKLRFVAAWAGNLIAAARAAGYKHPRDAAYKLMKDPKVVRALQTKQESMLQQSGEHLARTLPLSRADVIDRLWQLAQLDPDRTHCNITGQVKAAQALEQIFALSLNRHQPLNRQFQGKSEAELEFYVVHGFLPYPDEPKPALVASQEAPQLPATDELPVSASTSDSLASPGTPSRPVLAERGGSRAPSPEACAEVSLAKPKDEPCESAEEPPVPALANPPANTTAGVGDSRRRRL